MTAPSTITAAERRAAMHADLAHSVGKHLPPDPGLSFRVDLRVGRRAAGKAMKPLPKRVQATVKYKVRAVR